MSDSINLLERIAAEETRLSRAERRVAVAVLAAPKDAVGENIAVLAKRAQVSEPTVFRFCKSFGFDGFPAFKNALSVCLTQDIGAAVKKVKSGESVADITAHVIEGTVSALNSLARHLDLAAVARSIDLLAGSRRVIIASSLVSAAAAADFKFRLMRMGLVCEVFSDAEEAVLAAAALKPSELLIIIDPLGSNQQLLSLVEIARGNLAAAVSISPKDSKLAQKTLLNLAALGFDDFFADDLLCSLASVQAIVSILCSGVMLRRHDALAPVREKIEKQQKRLYEPVQKAEQEDAESAVSEVLDPNAPITQVNFDF